MLFSSVITSQKGMLLHHKVYKVRCLLHQYKKEDDDYYTMIDKENVRKLSEEELRICQTEYIRRWRYKNKDRVNSYARDYRKKRTKKTLF